MRYIFFILLSVLVFRSEKCNAQSSTVTIFQISGLVLTQKDSTLDRVVVESIAFSDSSTLNQHMIAKRSALTQSIDAWNAMSERDQNAYKAIDELIATFDAPAPGFIRRDVSSFEFTNEALPNFQTSKTVTQLDAGDPDGEPVAVTRYRIVWVRDADTYWIQTPNGILKIRPIGFDADEIKGNGEHLKQSQPFGEFERDTLRAMLMGDSIDIRVLGFDVYGRTLVVATWRGQDLATLMIRNGWADYLTTSHLTATQRKALQTERDKAKRAKRGRWQNKEVVTPRKWRKQYKA